MHTKPNGSTTADNGPHPLDDLSAPEIELACNVVRKTRGEPIWIKVCTLREPRKAKLAPYLDAERTGESLPPRPAREADVLYFVLSSRELYESVVDLSELAEVKKTIVTGHHAPLDRTEQYEAKAMLSHDPIYQNVMSELALPPDVTVVPQGWPMGSDVIDETHRQFMFLLYHSDPATSHPESNHYAFPLPVVLFWDVWEKKVCKVEWCATAGEGLDISRQRAGATKDHRSAEYLPELRKTELRQGLKPLRIEQPEGVSFTVKGRLVEWQGWRFRVGFNYREGPVIHSVSFLGRPLFYRLSLSEMHVPYADPRDPLHLKQVFDFGDIGLGRSANSLQNGCDCLGRMKYFDTVEVTAAGVPKPIPSVICMHEQDAGLLWKHTNGPTGVASAVRQRQLAVQTIITVGNYDYIFAWIFDQAGAVHMESRATGILSTSKIDVGEKSPYGTVVAPGVLGTFHQHFINVRVDPCIDGHKNTVVQEDVLPDPITKENKHGIAFRVHKTPITKSSHADLDPTVGRSFKITNPNVTNPVSMTPVGYKLVHPPSQLRLAHPDAHISSRAPFTFHHLHVTSHRDGELYPAGTYTNQSRGTSGGVHEWVARGDNVENEDIVVWVTFGITHIVRTEDWPVMPVETHMVSLKPSNFFVENPAMDVPRSNQAFNQSTLVNGDAEPNGHGCCSVSA